MASPREEKKSISKKIVGLVNERGEVDKKILISSLKLKTGFSGKIINDIVEDMIVIGVLRDHNGKLTFGEDPGLLGE